MVVERGVKENMWPTDWINEALEGEDWYCEDALDSELNLTTNGIGYTIKVCNVPDVKKPKI